jgi:NMT1/THI5 like
VTAGVLTIAAALIAAVYFWSPHANLRVTTGPPGSAAYRFITAFASVTEATHPRVRIKLVQVNDLAASAKAIEDHATDLGIVRSDGPIPSNGETIAILRRDVVAFVVPAKSPIDKIPSLAGKTIGLPQGPLQKYNEQTLDSILSYYNIPANSVKRVFLRSLNSQRRFMTSRWRRFSPSARWGRGRPSTLSAPSSLRPRALRASSPSTRRTRSTSGFPGWSRSTCPPEPSEGGRPSPTIR